MKSFRFIVPLVFLFQFACDEPVQQVARTNNKENPNEPMIRENKSWAKTEDALIESYLERNQLDMTRSGTGLRYKIYREGAGVSAKKGMIAEIRYHIKLLDGSLVYQTPTGKTETFLIGRDDVETGLHEGITYMKVGDKALFVIPSHLGHGLTGDLSMIPPRATLIFDLELLGLQ